MTYYIWYICHMFMVHETDISCNAANKVFWRDQRYWLLCKETDLIRDWERLIVLFLTWQLTRGSQQCNGRHNSSYADKWNIKTTPYVVFYFQLADLLFITLCVPATAADYAFTSVWQFGERWSQCDPNYPSVLQKFRNCARDHVPRSSISSLFRRWGSKPSISMWLKASWA